jgi:mono/diheme cytochrome c family protein
MKFPFFQFLFAAGLFIPPPSQAADFTDADRLFTLKVQPLLSEKCNGCHGDDAGKIKGDYNMLTREGLLSGGETFGSEVLVPGDAAKSFLMETIRWSDPDFEMPPKENDRLTEEQIKQVETWINAGAPWPEEATQFAIREEEKKQKVTTDGIIINTSGGLGDEWTYRRYQPEDIWAFLPVIKPEIPVTSGRVPASQLPTPISSPNPIDAFIGAKLADAKVAPAPQANPLILIRRATYDLIGLPPTPGEVYQFQQEWKKDKDAAWTALIDRLLDSPRYGERWAQHWLDVARYADTGGFSNDYERSNAWRYRDYVIRAFNDDKPYDRFVIEQLAGDELADQSVAKRVGDDPQKVHATRLKGDYNEQEAEWLIASGFLRMGAWDNAMVKNEEARQLYLDDVVNSVGQTFLSTTMRCFKCHDHKFDPLPTRDYYAMYAIFAGTQMAERHVPFLKEENRAGFAEGKTHVERMLAFAKKETAALVKKREDAARKWFEEHNLPYLNEQARRNLDDDSKPPRHVGLSIPEQGQLKVREQDVWIWTRRLERYQPMAQSVYNGSQKYFGNMARKLRVDQKQDRDWKPEITILTGGSLEAPGEPVTPGVLSLLGVPSPTGTDKNPYALPETLEGRRLGLAQWITDARNPLTARSIVNRIWQHHFTKPLAGNPNNFGAKGRKPTHPELLDWLAADFVENGWTMKRLHRLIMSSDAYRRSGQHPEHTAVASEDPNNHLLAYFPARRLTAEELRDSFLSLTGELNPAFGGLPANPEINMEVALQPRMIQFSLAPAYQPNPTPEKRNRRTIYAYRVRGLADPFLELFNQPNPNDSCEARDSAAVSPQAFTLLNSDVITDRSIAFAERLKEQAKTPTGQIAQAFHLTFGRNPDADEIQRLETYLADMTVYHQSPASAPQHSDYPKQITRSLVEELSGETFEYQEILPAFESYQPDKKPADVSPETRALADVCLLLLNSNEFAYIY